MTEFEALPDLLGGFLHQDVFEDYETIEDAVDDFARAQVTMAPRLHAEVEAVLDQYADEASLKDALHGMGLQVLPLVAGWPSYRAWLLAVADRVDVVLQKQQRPA